MVEVLASNQLGLFTLAQAREVGMPQQTIAYHAGPEGRWQRVFPGVYRLTGLPPDPRRMMLGAQLWAGPAAVLSHRAAAVISALDGADAAKPELWSSDSKVTEGIIVHRGSVPRAEIMSSGPFRHTTVVRTVLDLACVLDDDALELAVESALRRDPRVECDLLSLSRSGRRGCRALQRVLAGRPPGTPPTESELETRYVQLIRMVGVPPPVRQLRVINDSGRILGRLDLCWPEAQLWVELDGVAYHDRPEALLRDRRRQNALAAELQWLPLRFTWPDVVHHPTETASQTELVYRRRMAALGAVPATSAERDVEPGSGRPSKGG
jgi:hypothetical protein